MLLIVAEKNVQSQRENKPAIIYKMDFLQSIKKQVVIWKDELIQYSKKHPYTLAMLLLLFVAGIFLRLYRLPEYVTFLGDQGRDAIIIKRLITLEDLPAIGAPSSVGGMFLGPLYYYYIAPFLPLFGFNPVGLAYGVAITSIVAIFAIFFIVKKEINLKTATFFLILLTFSGVNILLSRFSWNPNLLSFFAFVTLWFFYKTLVTKKYLFAVLFGTFLGFCSNLHHLSLTLVFPMVMFLSFYLYKSTKKDKVLYTKLSGISFAFFVLMNSPLILFDLKNDFLNSKNFIKFLTTPDPDKEPIPLVKRFFETNAHLFEHIFKIELHDNIWLLIYAIFIVTAIWVIKKTKNKKNVKLQFLILNLLQVVLFIPVFSLVNSFRHPHYYGAVYLSFFFVLAYMLAIFIDLPSILKIKKNKKLQEIVIYILITAFLSSYIFNNLSSRDANFLKTRGSFQVEYAQEISDFIYPKITKEPYQMVSLPATEMHHQYRYFLEVMGKRPLPLESPDPGEQIIVICPHGECDPLGSGQWQIAAFHNARIGETWDIDNMKIYRIIHKQ
jgi:hypothetical protein